MKISEKLQQAHKKLLNTSNPEPTKPTFSFEFFVPKTSQGVQNLYDRMDRMYDLNPQFIDITWNAGGRLSTLTNEMVATAQLVLGLETCMHLTCTNMPVSFIDTALQSAYDAGCQNILALRGDPPVDGSESTGDFQYATDLIKHIRKHYGDYFNIGVAAYPEGHPEDDDVDLLITYLKQKYDCGASFIVTQMFYDVEKFIAWCANVRAAGIDIPIIPGIMPISTWGSFMRRAKWCEINIPDYFLEQLEPIQDDDQAVREVGTDLVAEMCRKMVDSGYVNHLHFYTMNLEKATTMVLEKLNLLGPPSLESTPQPESAVSTPSTTNKLPWRKSLNPNRTNETIRPIFWQNRKHSYVIRTANWDEFPNGRWGDSRSPAFGDVDFHSGQTLLRQTSAKALEMWGLPQSPADLAEVFVDYLNGGIPSFPWSDGALSNEINIIRPQLVAMNRKGVFSVNSQPSVNGAPSNNSIFGWGPANGFVYQKQYLEFFIHKDHLASVIGKIRAANGDDEDAGFNVLTYYAVNVEGELQTNAKEDEIHAVTWGIFPGQEVVQPTIVEQTSFLAWKDEAFQIVNEWANALKLEKRKQLKKMDSETEGDEAVDLDRFDTSVQLLDQFQKDYVLCNVVDHDFVHGNDRIFSLFSDIQ
ncbi:hypothetical protein BABINDRAFT_15698 [Babjeviella inositovora NRRL Y-12698]|uniref:MTHFR SAM-binding regulatory domain-containing protein n=1 Tax=Babjeviella inositovora NRRL Y-12698 TaxID=984486 RepID=A0A1E3QHM9_9ASCO|nr:uncharacterized protein BABINDRAFT_15698 [Babjeviella inositovora NRRL Y-12698]ODQ77205.1 hypothetical protein BABINDRAFT_15698 [Babjeviella inositovora NRRL Y-12698]